ncbi:MAG TPA: YciI-like protein [Acidimicrobiales bacterium]|nr:YciI-like protein [Acidimicrobiales bacterium]
MATTRYWLLFYDYVPDILERRGPFRDAHLGRAREAHDRGTLVFAGALGDPVDGALFVFSADDRAVVEDFARDDPYVREGLVPAWKVRPWNVVVGGDEAP